MVTLLHLDLDGFSAINNGLGQQVGDRLLDVVARRLEAVVADQPAMVARLGADEFAILIEAGESIPDVGAFAEIINTELAESLYIDGIGVAVTATIGVVQHRVAGTNPEELMRAASATLSRIRGGGKRQWALFDPQIDAVERAELRLAAAMSGAMETGELTVTYQPVVTLDDHRLVGVEPALSWQHPQLSVLSNEHRVQAAERTGAVHEVGQWLLRTAAEQAMSWRQRIGPSVPPVVVNLMAAQAQDPDLVARVRAVLDQTGLTPEGAGAASAGGSHPHGHRRTRRRRRRTRRRQPASASRAWPAHRAPRLRWRHRRVPLLGRPVRIRGENRQPISQQVANDPSRIVSQTAQAMVHSVRAAGVDVVAFPVDSAKQAACWLWIGANWAVGALFGQPAPPQHIEALRDAQADS